MINDHWSSTMHIIAIEVHIHFTSTTHFLWQWRERFRDNAMDLQTDQAKQWDLSDCRKHRSTFVGYELVLHLKKTWFDSF